MSAIALPAPRPWFIPWKLPWWLAGVAAIIMAMTGLFVSKVSSDSGYSQDCSLSSVSYLGTFWPDETCTGVPPGVTLTDWTGSTTINVDSTVIDAKNFGPEDCPILIRADNVTIKRSLFTCAGGNDAICNNCDAGGGGTGLIVEDVEINCGTVSGATAITQEHYTARRVNVYGCDNGMWAELTVTVENSYQHDNVPADDPSCPEEGDPPEPNCHTDGIQMPAGATGVTITHNTLYGNFISVDPDRFGNSAITSGGGVTNVTIDDNVLAGGGFPLRLDENLVGGNTNSSVTNNRLSKIFVSTYGGFGACNGNIPSGFNSSGNVDHETNSAVSGCN